FVAAHGDARHRQGFRRQRQINGPVHAEADDEADRRNAPERPPGRPPRPPAFRTHLRAPEALVRWGSNRHQCAVSLCVSACTSTFGNVPIDPAPSVITASPGRTILSSSGTT